MSLPESFSEREKEVAALLLEGKSNKQIAQALGIATRTAEFHVSNLYEKMGVTSRAEAILALSEPHLREPAGTQMRDSTGGNLRDSTVASEPDPKENGEDISAFIRRIKMNKLLLVVFIALIVVACLVPVIAIILFNIPARQANVVQTVSVAEEVVSDLSTHTPWVTRTPYEVTRTPYEVTQTPWVVETAPQPVLTAAPIQPEGDRYSFEGVNLAVNPSVGAGVNGQVILENPGSPDGPGWEIRPQTVRLSFSEYPLQGAFHEPVISIFPAEDYRRLQPLAGEAIDELAALLAEKPAVPDRVPFFPLINAGQVFRSNVEYLDFENGSGVRYLTLLAQYPAPINNHELFYAFQGLTADGQHVVSVVMPVNHPSLPVDADALSQSEMEAIWADPEYYSDMTASLSAEPDGSFTPDLAALDALVTSLRIDR